MTGMGLDVDYMSNILKSLGHPIRLEILLLLNEDHGYQFGELASQLKIESSGKLSFHLNKLEDLITKADNGQYVLNDRGHKAVEALYVMGLSGRDSTQPTVEHLDNDKLEPDGFFAEITTAKFLLLSSLLAIVVLPIFYIGGILLGAIYYRLVDQRGVVELRRKFNQYLLLPGIVIIPVILLTGTYSVIDLLRSGGLFSLFLVTYTASYFLGAWLYVFFSNERQQLQILPDDLYTVFREVLVLGIVSIIIYLLQLIFSFPPFFEVERTFDTINTYMEEIYVTGLVRVLMVALLVGFYIHIVGIQFDSMAELILTRIGRTAISIMAGAGLLGWAMAYAAGNDISHISTITWYGFWVVSALVAGTGAYFGQITGMRYTSGRVWSGSNTPS